MDVDIAKIDEKSRFDVKLQISLYNTARKVFREDKREEFERYVQERVEKIRKILNIEGDFRILEDGELLLEVRQ